jgi:hypothetical protein
LFGAEKDAYALLVILGYPAVEIVAPVTVATVFIAVMSLIKEPMRQQCMVLGIAGAGAAYISGGGLGVWEFPFTISMSGVAYLGFRSYRFIGIGWLLHTGWDVLHHLSGNPIIPFLPTSSFGCAVCDPVIALWCFADAPSLAALIHRWTGRASPGPA